MPFFGWRLTENFFLSPLLCQNRVHQNGPSFSSGRRDFSLFFPIKHFSNWLKKKYIILIILLVFSIKNQKISPVRLYGAIWGCFRRHKANRNLRPFYKIVFLSISVSILYRIFIPAKSRNSPECPPWRPSGVSFIFTMKFHNTSWCIIPIHAKPWWQAFFAIFLLFPQKFSKVHMSS